MKNSRKLLFSLTAAAAFAAAGTNALAFPGGPPGWGGGPGYGGPPAFAGPGGFGPGFAAGPRGFGPSFAAGPRGAGPGFAGGPNPAYTDARLASLKTALKITSDQESAWSAFAKQAKQQVESAQALLAKAAPVATSAPERLTQRTEFAKQRSASMEAMSGAFKNLYAALTPEQKTLADGYLGGRAFGQFGGRGPWR